MNNREKTDWKEMNRASRTCEMNMEGLIFVIIGDLDKRKEIEAEKSLKGVMAKKSLKRVKGVSKL